MYKYRDLEREKSSEAGKRTIVSHTIEVSTLGFISDIKQFTSALKLPHFPIELMKSIVLKVLSSSHSIYCKRNSNELVNVDPTIAQKFHILL